MPSTVYFFIKYFSLPTYSNSPLNPDKKLGTNTTLLVHLFLSICLNCPLASNLCWQPYSTAHNQLEIFNTPQHFKTKLLPGVITILKDQV